jgi:DNA segregation ATPase FtsK/SpoIIIE, S-DNA-T family
MIPLFALRRTAQADLAGAGYPLADTNGKTTLDRSREAAALLLLAAAAYAALALASFHEDALHPEMHGGDWVGPVGASFARASAGLLGAVAWCIPTELVLFASPLLKRRASIANVARLGGDVLVACILSALVHIAAPAATVFGSMAVGGSFGELFGEVMRSLFSTLGSYIIGLTVIGLVLIGRASFSFIAWMERAGRGTEMAKEGAKRGAKAVLGAWEQARDIERERLEKARQAAEPLIDSSGGDRAIIAAIADDNGADDREPPVMQIVTSNADSPITAALTATPSPTDQSASPAPALDPVPTDEPTLCFPDKAEPCKAPEPRREPKKREKKPADGPVIVDTSGEMACPKPARTKASTTTQPAHQEFRLPSTDLLEPPPATVLEVDREQLKSNAKLLEKTLADYGVQGTVEEIHPGPTVTTYELSPQAGTKVSKVASLADDLALGLSRKVRIIAPIPGKNRIGFELPNEARIPVSLRDLIEDPRFTGLAVPLPVVLGRDQVGHPFFADLASMPHVIVAGATGAGKSVGLNVMLASLLYRRTPEELRLLMIDPKVVELAPFDRIPHMLLPVVTDMKQAANALKWAVDEMERRYQLFANAGTKNIATYNAWTDRVQKGLAKAPPVKKVTAIDASGDAATVAADADGSDQKLPDRLPYIVIVVDEFSDLMMQQGKDVEAAVARLAQKARAAGMHVILATQRPSVDVITGIIKANFPTRIAYRVSQKVDSRTILDEQGAEHLLGRGDMLIKMNGTNDTRRVQCPFISEEEVQKVADFLRLQGAPVYDENILKPRDDDAAKDAANDAEMDPEYDKAVRLVAETRRCSTSWIQRKLFLGYNRAARIVEAMEQHGVVGPANGAKEREVLIGTL